jgi:hypothetical protein
MKKLLLLLLCVPLIFSCGEREQRKSWLEQWGYKGKMKSAEYTTYYASIKLGEISKESVILEPFESIDEWILPYAKTQYNIYGDIKKRVWYADQEKEIGGKRLYVYNNNELNYIKEEGKKIKAINDPRGYLIKLDFSELGYVDGTSFTINDNGYITEISFGDQIQKHQYDINGNWIQCDIYHSNTSELIRRTKLSYDQNKREEALTYNSDGNLFQRHQYGKYDKENNFTEIIIFDSKNNPLFIIDYTRKYYE